MSIYIIYKIVLNNNNYSKRLMYIAEISKHKDMPIISGIAGGLVNMHYQRKAGRTLERGRDEYIQNWEQLLEQMKGNLGGYEQDINRLLESQLHKRYMDTAESQAAQTQARTGMREGMSQALANVSRGGGTDAARLAATGQVGQQYGDFMNRMAGYGTQWAQGNRDRLMAARGSLYGARQDLVGAKGQHAQNLYSMAQDKARAKSAAGQAFGSAMGGIGDTMSPDQLFMLLGGGA